MKNSRLLLSAFIVFAVVASALAFKTKPLQQGSVYCGKDLQTGACTNRIDYRVAQTTTNITDPCANGAGKEYVLSPTCTEILSGQFEVVDP